VPAAGPAAAAAPSSRPCGRPSITHHVHLLAITSLRTPTYYLPRPCINRTPIYQPSRPCARLPIYLSRPPIRRQTSRPCERPEISHHNQPSGITSRNKSSRPCARVQLSAITSRNQLSSQCECPGTRWRVRTNVQLSAITSLRTSLRLVQQSHRRAPSHPGDNIKANGTSHKWTSLGMLPESGSIPCKSTPGRLSAGCRS